MKADPINRKDFLAPNFYKKTDENEQTTAYFEVVYWPGPYNFAKTDEKLKQTADFPFTEEGIQAVADFLNEQYVKQQELWKL